MKKGRSKIEKICPTCLKPFHPWITHRSTQVFCRMKCIRRTQEFKDNLSRVNTGRIDPTRGKPRPNRAGKNCHFWRGGVSKINRTERQNFSRTTEYRNFREEVLKRDSYRCVLCGEHSYKGRGTHCYLYIDHIKPYSLFPELRTDTNNARTLCGSCNRKTETYGTRVFKFKRGDFEYPPNLKLKH